MCRYTSNCDETYWSKRKTQNIDIWRVPHSRNSIPERGEKWVGAGRGVMCADLKTQKLFLVLLCCIAICCYLFLFFLTTWFKRDLKKGEKRGVRWLLLVGCFARFLITSLWAVLLFFCLFFSSIKGKLNLYRNLFNIIQRHTTRGQKIHIYACIGVRLGWCFFTSPSI